MSQVKIPFIDLKAQYHALKPQIQSRIDAVLIAVGVDETMTSVNQLYRRK